MYQNPNTMQRQGLHSVAEPCGVRVATSLPLSRESLSYEAVAESEQIKVCGTCRCTLARFKGYVWIEDFCRAVDCLCEFRRGEYEIVLTCRVVEAMRVIAKLANSKVYCYKERCWVKLLEPACVFYTDREAAAES